MVIAPVETLPLAPVVQLAFGIASAPILEQEVALVIVQPIVLEALEAIEVGLAVSETVGKFTTVTFATGLVTVPPAPVQRI